jgi:hypothetical protein
MLRPYESAILMTSSEWSLVRRLAAIVLVAALFPIGALTYRLYINPDTTFETPLSVTPVLFTLVPESTKRVIIATPNATAVVLVVPNGWSEYPVAEENFVISVPPTWRRLPVSAQELAASLQVIRQSNPELATALGANAQQLMQSGIKFWAYDPDPEGLKSRFATNLTVTRQTLPSEVSFDAYVLVNVNQIEQLSTRQGPVSHQRITLSNLPAEKVRYNLVFQSSDGTSITSAITLYLLLNRNDAYVLTYATRLDQIDHYAATFDQGAATFRLLGQ